MNSLSVAMHISHGIVPITSYICTCRFEFLLVALELLRNRMENLNVVQG